MRTLYLGPNTFFDEGLLLLESKLAASSLTYSLDLTSFLLATVDSLVSSSLTLAPNPLLPNDLQIFVTTSPGSSVINFELSAGTSGVTYTLLLIFTTQQGYIWQRNIQISIL